MPFKLACPIAIKICTNFLLHLNFKKMRGEKSENKKLLTKIFKSWLKSIFLKILNPPIKIVTFMCFFLRIIHFLVSVASQILVQWHMKISLPQFLFLLLLIISRIFAYILFACLHKTLTKKLQFHQFKQDKQRYCHNISMFLIRKNDAFIWFMTHSYRNP